MKKFLAMSVSLILTAAMICGCSKASSDNGSTGSATGGAVAANGVVKVIDVNLTEEKYAFGVDKKQPELLKSANDFIKEIKETVNLMRSVTTILEAASQRLLSLPS